MRKTVRRALPVFTVLLICGLWEAAVRVARIPLYVLPAPSQVVLALFSDFPVLLRHAAITTSEALTGIVIALGLALMLGILMDAFPLLKQCIYPVLVVTQTVPMVVLAPIFIIYLGFGMAPKIVTVVLMCFFPIAVSFADGMEQINPGYINLMRSYGASKAKLYTLVKIPAAVPSLISGLKVAATYSISGAVVGEWVAAQRGLGYYLIRVKNSYMLDKVFACVLMIVLLSLLMNGAIALVQRLFKPKTRQVQF